MTDSEKLAQVWVGLREVKLKIDGEIIPVGHYLGIDDPDLILALETLSEKIGNHFERFKLEAIAKKMPELHRR
jgi:hypothetical protein